MMIGGLPSEQLPDPPRDGEGIPRGHLKRVQTTSSPTGEQDSPIDESCE